VYFFFSFLWFCRFRWSGGRDDELVVDIDSVVEFVLEATGDETAESDSDSERSELKYSEEEKTSDSKEDDNFDFGEGKTDNIQGGRHRHRTNRFKRTTVAASVEESQPLIDQSADDSLDMCSEQVMYSKRIALLNMCERNGLTAVKLAAMRGEYFPSLLFLSFHFYYHCSCYCFF
jgi:hypothetical protein